MNHDFPHLHGYVCYGLLCCMLYTDDSFLKVVWVLLITPQPQNNFQDMLRGWRVFRMWNGSAITWTFLTFIYCIKIEDVHRGLLWTYDLTTFFGQRVLQFLTSRMVVIAPLSYGSIFTSDMHIACLAWYSMVTRWFRNLEYFVKDPRVESSEKHLFQEAAFCPHGSTSRDATILGAEGPWEGLAALRCNCSVAARVVPCRAKVWTQCETRTTTAHVF